MGCGGKILIMPISLRRIILKIPIPTLIGGGCYVGITGEIPFLEKSMDDLFMGDLLASLDLFLYEVFGQPIILVFSLGLVVSWVIYQIIVVGYMDRRKRARLRLVKLRDEGVRIRIRGIDLKHTDEVGPWATESENWHGRVVKEISKIDEADAGQYNTLDFPGSARIDLPAYLNAQHTQSYIVIDRRLAILAEYMTKYGAIQ